MMGQGFVGGIVPHMYRGFGMFGGWSVIVMGIGLLVIAGVLIWALFSQKQVAHGAQGAVPGVGMQVPVAPAVDTAETIVRERFARGEIDREEYDRTIATLRTTR